MISKIILLTILAIVIALILSNWKKVVGLFKRLGVFKDEVLIEMKRVAWPGREELANSTIMVGVTTIIVTILVGIVDKILGSIVRLIF